MSTDQEATNFTIVETAQRLGVSENAIRQRIKRHTLLAVKVNGIWRVTLPDHETDPQATIRTDYQTDQVTDHEVDQQGDQEATVSAVSASARAQLASIRDEFIAPLVVRIEDLSRDVGRLGAERDAAVDERDRLRDEVTQLQRAQEVSRVATMHPGEAEGERVGHGVPRPWWRFWDR